MLTPAMAYLCFVFYSRNGSHCGLVMYTEVDQLSSDIELSRENEERLEMWPGHHVTLSLGATSLGSDY